MTSIPYHLFIPIKSLIDDCTQANPSGISVKNKRLLEICEGQDGGSAAEVLDSIKGLLTLVSSLHQPVLLAHIFSRNELIQWLGD